MWKADGGQANPELKKLVVDASCALARLDTARLEELALSCQALNGSLETLSVKDRTALARQARDAQNDMAVFGRVLQATSANLSVMNRLRELRMENIEYSERQARGDGAAEANYGND